LQILPLELLVLAHIRGDHSLDLSNENGEKEEEEKMFKNEKEKNEPAKKKPTCLVLSSNPRPQSSTLTP